MAFTTQVFTFVFFPIVLLLFFISVLVGRNASCKTLKDVWYTYRFQDLFFILVSLLFYSWASVSNVYKFTVYILCVYLLAKFIVILKGVVLYAGRENESNALIVVKKVHADKVILIISIILVLGCLCYYSYYDFLRTILSGQVKGVKSIVAPIGWSFITFSAISYLVDIYRENATEGNFMDCALYFTFFPKVVSGPIVLWKDFQIQIKNRQELKVDQFIDGINLIMIGFAKKLILADSFGNCLSKISLNGIDQITALGTIALYTLQIYYDFSGYSDIAIGLAKLFGFEIKDNFYFPYRSASISEFWRRWHISLGTWFREYVYFPLGGSRKGSLYTAGNLMVVFLLTGIWHGAGINYVLWGILNGLVVVLEHSISNKEFYNKIHTSIKRIVTMSLVMIFWQIFRLPNLKSVSDLFFIIIGKIKFDTVFYTWEHYYDTRILVFMLLGIIGAVLFGNENVLKVYYKIVSSKVGYFLQEIILLIIFLIAILFMINSTYSPFIYFQY